MTPLKIISGGQTGVDRAALDAGYELGLEIGGWCPKGRIAEDGPIPDKYPLRETGTSSYSYRTTLNIDHSEGTLVLARYGYGPGTQKTIDYAVKRGKLVGLIYIDTATAKDQVVRQMRLFRPRCLNIAGPRESKDPGVYQATLDFIVDVLPVQIP